MKNISVFLLVSSFIKYHPFLLGVRLMIEVVKVKNQCGLFSLHGNPNKGGKIRKVVSIVFNWFYPSIFI